MQFGISTHLYHGEPLSRRHFERIAAHGFRLVEVFATRTHFDYHDARRVAEVGTWMRETGLTPWSLHAPICDGFVGGVWGRAYSNASTDAASRQEAVEETRASITAARDLGCGIVVLHLGIPRGQPIPAGDNDVGAMRRSLESIADACRDAGLRLALEVIPNDLATPAALIDWLEGDMDLGSTGVCLDYGHAHLVGGATEAIEALSGHVITTHVHDNRGDADTHLVPFDGAIDWPTAMMATSKIGYTGPLIYELPDHGDTERVLQRAVGAERRLQAILDDLTQPLGFDEA